MCGHRRKTDLWADMYLSDMSWLKYLAQRVANSSGSTYKLMTALPGMGTMFVVIFIRSKRKEAVG